MPASALAHPARHGEAFVSMGVSYWEAGNRNEAMRLTEQGIKLMEQAIEAHLLNKTALAIPYSNLASMCREQGQEQQAKQFAILAARCEKPDQR